MFFLLQTTETALEIAKDVNPFTPYVWGLLTLAGWAWAVLQWRELNKERSESKEDARDTLKLMSKVEIHLSQQHENTGLIKELKMTVEQLREEVKEKMAAIAQKIGPTNPL